MPDILRLTGLSTKLHNYPDQLSGGEQQRVAVARAFVNHPPLLLADEPTGNLDPETSIGIMQLLYRINRTGTTVIVATHDNAMVDQMRRRVIELQGRIVRDEAPARRPRRSTARPGCAIDLRGDRGVRLLLRARPARAAPQRRAELRGDGDDAGDDARARRLHPDRPGDDGRRQRGAQARARRRLPAARRQAGRRRARARAVARTPHVKRVEYVSKEQAYAASEAHQARLRAARLQPAARHLPRDPDKPDDVAKMRNALAPVPPAAAARAIDRAIDEVRNRGDDTNKILTATRVVKLRWRARGAARASRRSC